MRNEKLGMRNGVAPYGVIYKQNQPPFKSEVVITVAYLLTWGLGQSPILNHRP